MISKTPDLFWGVITSMYPGNILLLILNLPLIGVWIQLLKVPYRILCALILLFCLIGVYSLNNSIFEIYLMGGFRILGYIFKKLDFEPAPLILAVVLGPMLEDTLKHTLLISGGDLTVFFSRPISAAFLSVVATAGCLPADSDDPQIQIRGFKGIREDKQEGNSGIREDRLG